MKLSKQCFLITLLFFVFTLSSCVQTLPISNSLFNPNDEEAWVQDLVGKTSAEQSEIAAKVWSDSSKPLKLRDRATYILASRNNANTKVALSSLASQYAQSTDEYKKYMEET